MQDMLAAETAKLLELQTLRLLALVLGAVVSDLIARGALKMNCLAHVPVSVLCAPPLRQKAFAFGFAGFSQKILG